MSLYKKIINEVAKVVKKEINEAFDFDSVNKLNRKLNAYDTLLSILEKIKNMDDISENEYEILILFDSIYKVENKDILQDVIRYAIDLFDDRCNLNWIDVSNITDMTEVFSWSEFNGDISKWDVSNVTNMMHMFKDSLFNGDISKWDVGNVTNMYGMFEFSVFNKDISQWDVSNVIDMCTMFKHSKFNKDISLWDIKKANRHEMFTNCPIKDEYLPKSYKINEGFDFDSVNKEKKSINIFPQIRTLIKTPYKKLTLDEKDFLKSMKDSMPIVKPISRMELKAIISHSIKLFGPDCDLNWLDTSDIANMSNIFENTKFNGDISLWDTSNVTNMDHIFANSIFNGDISGWDVSNVTNMDSMFWASEFNGDISSWDVSSVTNMSYMFAYSKFNNNISNWDVSNVTNMHYMFANSNFNRNIGNWDVSNVTSMSLMFQRTAFNWNISKWNVNNVLSMSFMFENAEFNHDISNWNINPECNTKYMFDNCDIIEEYKPKKPQINEAFDFGSVNKEKKSINIANYIYDTVEEIIGKDKNINISIERYNLLKSCIGIYKPKNKRELQRIIKRCMKFGGNECDLNWIDVSNITNMAELFYRSKFTGDISKWDVSNVTNMEDMFHGSKFNGDISLWDVRKVKWMGWMFAYSNFNGDISNWDVSNVESMRGMFEHSKFNRDISKWDVRVCCDMRWMFDECSIIDEYKPINVIKYGKGGLGNY